MLDLIMLLGELGLLTVFRVLAPVATLATIGNMISPFKGGILGGVIGFIIGIFWEMHARKNKKLIRTEKMNHEGEEMEKALPITRQSQTQSVQRASAKKLFFVGIIVFLFLLGLFLFIRFFGLFDETYAEVKVRGDRIIACIDEYKEEKGALPTAIDEIKEHCGERFSEPVWGGRKWEYQAIMESDGDPYYQLRVCRNIPFLGGCYPTIFFTSPNTSTYRHGWYYDT